MQLFWTVEKLNKTVLVTLGTLVTPSLILNKYLSARQEGDRRGLGGARMGPEGDWRGPAGVWMGPGGGQERVRRGLGRD